MKKWVSIRNRKRQGNVKKLNSQLKKRNSYIKSVILKRVHLHSQLIQLTPAESVNIIITYTTTTPYHTIFISDASPPILAVFRQ
ncbi:hypothetical protein QVD17_37225 [Tagetes erecta]|uniref:Uncharacterized protein n=1 Tax=Tagetes erecta TaxID=13708 RepID=A0AAD8NJN4_TARER|nr:hypothetical protein QVD17_37225 [Tagetes erecta]